MIFSNELTASIKAALYRPYVIDAAPGQKPGRCDCPECEEHGPASNCDYCNGWGYVIVVNNSEEE